MRRDRPSLLRSIGLWSIGVAARSILALLYIIVLARLLSVEDFAAWGIIVALGNALALISRPIGFWAPRLKEHGRSAGTAWTTGLLGSMVLALVTWLAIAVASESLGSMLNISPGYIEDGGPVIALSVVYGFTQLFLQSWRPEKEPLGMLIFETSRIATAIIPAAASMLAFETAILSHAAGMAMYVLYTGSITGVGRPDLRLLSEWLAHWRAPVVEGLANFLVNLARPAVSAVAGPAPVAYLNVGLSLSRVLFQVLMGVSWNVYSRLLGEPGSVKVERAAAGLLILAGLTVSAVAGFADLLALLFGPEYRAAGPVIVVLTARAAVNSVGVLYARVLQAQADIRLINRVALVLLAAQSASLILGGAAALLGEDPLEAAVYASLGMAAPSIFYTGSMVALAVSQGFNKPPTREVQAVAAGLASSAVAYVVWEPLAPVFYIITVLALSPFARAMIARITRHSIRQAKTR